MSDESGTHNGINIALQTLLQGQEGFGKRVDALTETVGKLGGSVVAVGQSLDNLDKGQTVLANEVQRGSRRMSDIEGSLRELKDESAQRKLDCGAVFKDHSDKLVAQRDRIAKVSGEVGPLKDTTGRLEENTAEINLREIQRQAANEALEKAHEEAQGEEARRIAAAERRRTNIKWLIGTLITLGPVIGTCLGIAHCGCSEAPEPLVVQVPLVVPFERRNGQLEALDEKVVDLQSRLPRMDWFNVGRRPVKGGNRWKQ